MRVRAWLVGESNVAACGRTTPRVENQSEKFSKTRRRTDRSIERVRLCPVMSGSVGCLNFFPDDSGRWRQIFGECPKIAQKSPNPIETEVLEMKSTATCSRTIKRTVPKAPLTIAKMVADE